MKRKILALAAIAFAAGASAQSSVTIFGIIDVGITHSTGSVSGKTQLSSNGTAVSQLGFRGTEDLGGGLKAGFWLESQLNPDNGSGASSNSNNQTSGLGPAGPQGITFNRRSTVGIGGDWGEIRMGRDFTPYYYGLALYDPYGHAGQGASLTLATILPNPTGVRASNSISYFYGHGFNSSLASTNPTGFHAQVMYYMGENASNAANSDDGTGYGWRVGYNQPVWTVGAAGGRTQYATGDTTQNNVGGSVQFGALKLVAHYNFGRLAAIKYHGGLIGGNYAISTGLIKVAFSTHHTNDLGSPAADKVVVGYQHNLSKRTSLYSHYAYVKNKGTSTIAVGGAVTGPGRNSGALEMGIRHFF
jgi:predicted porin